MFKYIYFVHHIYCISLYIWIGQNNVYSLFNAILHLESHIPGLFNIQIKIKQKYLKKLELKHDFQKT